MSDENTGLGAGLQEFLEWAGRTGEMNPKTAESWATSARRVLSVGGDPDEVDLRGLDVEALLDRFETLNRTKYSEASMTTYRSRFRRAVAAYLAWLDNEPWKSSTRTVVRKRSSSNGAKNAQAVTPTTEASNTVPIPQHGSTARLVSYTVPLRPDLMVTMTLPVDLNTQDAERIATFVKSLAFVTEPPVRMSARSEKTEQGE